MDPASGAARYSTARSARSVTIRSALAGYGMPDLTPAELEAMQRAMEPFAPKDYEEGWVAARDYYEVRHELLRPSQTVTEDRKRVHRTVEINEIIDRAENRIRVLEEALGLIVSTYNDSAISNAAAQDRTDEIARQALSGSVSDV